MLSFGVQILGGSIVGNYVDVSPDLLAKFGGVVLESEERAVSSWQFRGNHADFELNFLSRFNQMLKLMGLGVEVVPSDLNEFSSKGPGLFTVVSKDELLGEDLSTGDNISVSGLLSDESRVPLLVLHILHMARHKVSLALSSHGHRLHHRRSILALNEGRGLLRSSNFQQGMGVILLLLAFWAEVEVIANAASVSNSLDRVSIASITGITFVNNLSLRLFFLFEVLVHHSLEDLSSLGGDFFFENLHQASHSWPTMLSSSITPSTGEASGIDLGSLASEAVYFFVVICLLFLLKNLAVDLLLNSLNSHLVANALGFDRIVAGLLFGCLQDLRSTIFGILNSADFLFDGLDVGAASKGLASSEVNHISGPFSHDVSVGVQSSAVVACVILGLDFFEGYGGHSEGVSVRLEVQSRLSHGHIEVALAEEERGLLAVL